MLMIQFYGNLAKISNDWVTVKGGGASLFWGWCFVLCWLWYSCEIAGISSANKNIQALTHLDFHVRVIIKRHTVDVGFFGLSCRFCVHENQRFTFFFKKHNFIANRLLNPSVPEARASFQLFVFFCRYFCACQKLPMEDFVKATKACSLRSNFDSCQSETKKEIKQHYY